MDLQAYLRAGDDLLAGDPVYVGRIGEIGTFSYAPPWAVLFAALAWLPDTLVFVGVMLGSLLALRYVAGSWLWCGLVLLYPVSAMVIWAGNIEFYIAAAIVLAARGHAGPLAFTALAKIAPILGVPRDGWREAAIVIGLAVAITIPWLYPVARVDRVPPATARHDRHPHRAALVRAPALRAGPPAGAPALGGGAGRHRGHALAVAGEPRPAERRGPAVGRRPYRSRTAALPTVGEGARSSR